MPWNDEKRLRKRFTFVCPVKWDEMHTTTKRNVRYCEGCGKRIHLAETKAEFEEFAARDKCVFTLSNSGKSLVAKPNQDEGETEPGVDPPLPMPNPVPMGGQVPPPKQSTFDFIFTVLIFILAVVIGILYLLEYLGLK